MLRFTPRTAASGCSLDQSALSSRGGERDGIGDGTEHTSTDFGGGGSRSVPTRRRGRAGGPRSPDDVNPARLTALIRGAETVRQLCRLCEVHVAQVLLGETDTGTEAAVLMGADKAPLVAGGRSVHVAQVLLGEQGVGVPGPREAAVEVLAAGGQAGPSFRSRPPARMAMDSIAAAAAASRCGRRQWNRG